MILIKGAKVIKSHRCPTSGGGDVYVCDVYENKRPPNSLIAKKDVNFSGHLTIRQYAT